VSAPGYIVEVPPELPPHRRQGERALLEGQLSVIREMLGMLDTITIAGQRHLMEKVVTFVEPHARAAVIRPSARRRDMLFELVVQLRKESERLVPDSARFTAHAENLIALLGVVG
jgi:hypothetical protein